MKVQMAEYADESDAHYINITLTVTLISFI